MEKLFYIVAKGNDTAEVYMYGIIGQWGDIKSADFATEFKKLEGKYKTVNIYVNSDGGEVKEGIAIYNILSRSSMKINFYVDGVAASMMSNLIQVPGAKRYMSRHAKLMLHSPSGGAFGTADDLRDVADNIDDFENTLLDIYSTRTGLSVSDLKAKWFDGKDHWLNAEQALEEKLIDGIVDGKVKEAPKAIANSREVYNFYQSQITNFNKTPDMEKLPFIVAALSLQANASEQAVLDAIIKMNGENKQLKDENTSLKAQLDQFKNDAEAQKKVRIKALVDGAKTANKITDAEVETYTTLAESNFEAVEKILNARAPYKTIQSQLQNEDGDNTPDPHKGFTFDDFHKKAPAALAEMKAKQPERYKALYKAKFGKEPII